MYFTWMGTWINSLSNYYRYYYGLSDNSSWNLAYPPRKNKASLDHSGDKKNNEEKGREKNN